VDELLRKDEAFPRDSVERFLREHAARHAGGATTCLFWGPMPHTSISSALQESGSCVHHVAVVEAWEVDGRCRGGHGLHIWDEAAGEYARNDASAASWERGVACCEGHEVREVLQAARIIPAGEEGGVGVIVHTVAFANTLEPLDFRQAALLESLLDRRAGYLFLASPAYLIHAIDDSQAGRGAGSRDGILSASRVSLAGLTSALHNGGLDVMMAEEAGHNSALMAGVLLGLGYADFSHETLFQERTTTELSAHPHTLLTLSRRHHKGDQREASSSPGRAWKPAPIRVVALTQATHSYYQFVPGLARSLDTHLAAASLEAPSYPELDVLLVVFTDEAADDEHLAAFKADLSRLQVQHRWVPHYGWPALALRR
jgi:hypothetical protein